jgi:hypothetical protein
MKVVKALWMKIFSLFKFLRQDSRKVKKENLSIYKIKIFYFVCVLENP